MSLSDVLQKTDYYKSTKHPNIVFNLIKNVKYVNNSFPEVTCYVLSGTLNYTHSLSD